MYPKACVVTKPLVSLFLIYLVAEYTIDTLKLFFADNLMSNSLLQWCCARDLLGSQIPVTTGGFEL